jgi:thioredoxin reductase (NADPH)
MAKPVLLTVDDDPEVLRAVERDLRRQYGRDYRVLRAPSGAVALETLNQLVLRNEPVALMLVDQRMPQMNGVQFLGDAIKLFPAAKRVLLTAYADTDAAIKAINDVQIDYYLLKPWDPPETHLYPVIDDLLHDWQANYRPQWEGIRMIGPRWSPRTHALKDFMAGNQVPYQWLDIERSDEARQLVKQTGADDSCLPMVLFPDGSHLAQPSVSDLAQKVGLSTQASARFYDLIVVGGGPAGLAAAVYGASEGLSTLMIERNAPGGQAGTSSRIENYLGFPTGVSGADLARRAVTQARRFGVEILAPQHVTGVRVTDPYRYVKLSDGGEVSCHALLITTGVEWRKLDVPDLERYVGAGAYYGAAMTEAVSCQDEPVYVVGGANSAGQAAMYLAQYASHVTMLVRGEGLSATMSQYLIDQIAATSNITVLPHTSIAGVQGDDRLRCLILRNSQTGNTETVPVSALFIMIGAVPHTDWLDGVVTRDDHGFILSGPDLLANGKKPRSWKIDRDPFLLETSVPGIFVAGDVRRGSTKRVAAGVGEGSVAVSFVHQYLSTV